ncbi:hypothetical protein BGW80DRAFT_1377616 [Lactifluus volemus]|nr:hypothetical protein BGW80DRAFT_1377616 [Lactifluus volemus]
MSEPCVLLGSWQSAQGCLEPRDKAGSRIMSRSPLTGIQCLKISIPVSLLSLRASNVSPILSCQAQWGLVYDMLTRWQEIPSSLIPTLVQFKVYSSCLRAPDPHGCQCGCAALQTPTHIIFHCERFRAARDRHLRPVSQTLSPSIIFGTKKGGEALAKFIEETQAGVRPWRRERPPEDHG